MSIKGVIFENQAPTAKQMGAVFRPLYTDGILQGCEISYNGSNVFISPGVIMACGRPFELTTTENIELSGSGYARIIVNLDMNKSATEENFGQVYFTTETAEAASGFVTLEKENVNQSGTLYQLEVARFTISGGTVTGMVSSIHNVNSISEMKHETWTFTAKDGSTVVKEVVLWT